MVKELGIEAFIQKIPKAELHLHTEGTLEPELRLKIAERNSIKLKYKNVEEIKASYNYNDLTSFLPNYYEGVGVLVNERDFYDLTWAYVLKAKEENITHTEIFFDPQAHTRRGVDFKTVIKGIHRALVDGKEKVGISSKLIMCFMRDMPVDSAFQTLEESLPYKNWMVAVGLDSDERGNPPSKFKTVFDRAREEGYRAVAHCDVNQENSVAHIWYALNELKVSRIDHGINAVEDERLMSELKRRNVPLTICPISNQGVTGSMQEGAISKMIERELCVTINSDDPAYFRAYINDNYIALQKALNLNKQEICELAANSFKASFLDEKEKESFLMMLEPFRDS